VSDTGIEPNFIGSRNDYALAARSWPLGLAPGRTAPYPTEPDSATLRSRGAFKGLCWPDARQAANAIATEYLLLRRRRPAHRGRS